MLKFDNRLLKFNGAILGSPGIGYYNRLTNYARTNNISIPYNESSEIRKLLVDLFQAGILDRLDLLYLGSNDGSPDFRLINVVNPGTYNGTPYGGLTWTKEGVQGNGVNGYINTNFNPSLLVAGQKYRLNDAIRGAVISTIFSSADNLKSTVDGNLLSGNNVLLSRNSALSKINSGNGGNLPEAVDTSGLGLKAISRNSSTTVNVYSNVLYERIVNSVSLPDSNQFIFRRSDYYGNGAISVYFMGGFMPFEQTQLFRQLYNNYLTAIGLNPIA